MEAARLQLEEYSTQLAQVGEALELDPTNDALQELLTEIAQGIEATEALIGTLQGSGDEIGSKTNEKDSASDYSDIEPDDRSISDSDDSSDEGDDGYGWGAKESELIVSKTHYVGITSADAAGAWLKRTEMEVDESVGDAVRMSRQCLLLLQSDLLEQRVLTRMSCSGTVTCYRCSYEHVFALSLSLALPATHSRGRLPYAHL